MTENEELLKNVEEQASKAAKAEIDSFKNKMSEYATSGDLQKKFDLLSEEVNALGIKELKEGVDLIKGDVEKAIIQIKKIEEDTASKESEESFDQKLRKSLTDNADNLKAFKTKNTKDVSLITTLKATSIRSNVSGNTMAHRVPGIGQIQQRKPFMRELFSAGRISPNNHGVIRYVDQANRTSGATSISEAGAFPTTSAITWIERTLNVEKVGDSIKISREMMDDVDFVESEIKRLLYGNMSLAIDTQLLSGNGTTPNLKGMATSATAFSLNAVFTNKVVSPNVYDLMLIVGSQIASGTDYVANGVLLNDLDAALMGLEKNELGDYILPPFSVVTPNGVVSVRGMSVIGNSGVTTNTCYVGDFTRGTVYSSEELTFEFGYENDDFTKNLITLIGLERLALLIRVVDNGAFSYVSSISDQISAIKKGV